ncbi:PepSY domain-containing protein [Microbispora sp. KK1-11]|uniref:PepSY domain-containing protein n=1 Tax=Microbispora sp. KK1-11 TaxID=2053005 RepID=UPI0011577F19|nr:PepSY domain-containing protein [Microbispora sp. KK1-11]TQS29560.1 PepSY domain-containing protein [Microbispora sp. KK1-11]
MRQTNKIALAAAVTVAALAAGGTAVAAAAPAPLSSTASASIAQTSVTRSQAIAIATRRVPGARVTEVEREWEHGHRTWKIELRKGHREYKVYVAIATGRIVKFRAHHDD